MSDLGILKGFPRSGRLITESGDIFNEADRMAFEVMYSLLNETINNGASVLSIRLENLAAQTNHYFVLDIPEGKELIVYARELDLSEGRYLVDAIRVDTVSLAGASVGVTAPLDKTRAGTMETLLKHVSGDVVTNPVVREYGFADTGTAQTGQARTSGSTGIEGVIKRLLGPSILRVNKTNEGAFTANLKYVAWERNSE